MWVGGVAVEISLKLLRLKEYTTGVPSTWLLERLGMLAGRSENVSFDRANLLKFLLVACPKGQGSWWLSSFFLSPSGYWVVMSRRAGPESRGSALCP